MSEAKRFIVPLLQMWDCTGQPPALPSEQVVVIASELDRVTAERDALELRRRAEFDNSQAAERRVDVLEGLLFSLPEDLKALSGCENTAGVYACIDYIEQCIAGLKQVTAEGASHE